MEISNYLRQDFQIHAANHDKQRSIFFLYPNYSRNTYLSETNYFTSADFNNLCKREIFRFAVFLCRAPFIAPLWISDWAMEKAETDSLVPKLEMNFFIKVLTRLILLLFKEALFSFCLILFKADLWLAIILLYSQSIRYKNLTKPKTTFPQRKNYPLI